MYFTIVTTFELLTMEKSLRWLHPSICIKMIRAKLGKGKGLMFAFLPVNLKNTLNAKWFDV